MRWWFSLMEAFGAVCGFAGIWQNNTRAIASAAFLLALVTVQRRWWPEDFAPRKPRGDHHQHPDRG